MRRHDLPEIVLATDFSPDASAAADRARRYARAIGARVQVLHVSSLGATEEIVRSLEEVGERFEGIPVVLVVEKGGAAERIVAHAAQVGAELIVLGVHGRHGGQASPLGRVSEEVTRRATCPVLTVRAKALRAGRVAQAMRA